MNNNQKPHFYLKILNGLSMSFGIQVYLDHNRDRVIFSEYTSGNYDQRKDLFRDFVVNENLGLLTFSWDIYHQQSYIKMRWKGEKDEDENKGRQDCRDWIWEYQNMRNRVALKRNDGRKIGGSIFFRD
jgi:hypothetical protein